jgi:hypothetical protein
MPRRSAAAEPAVDVTALIDASAELVIRAFFEPAALSKWWQVTRSVTTPRTLGPYAVEWRTTDLRDEILGRFGGVFRGTVMQFEPAAGFFVADALWLPPDGDPIGPMALDVSCSRAVEDGRELTRLRVHQTGCDYSVRWRRYYELFSIDWEHSLAALKALLER